jgi:carbon monoxide dehydrogenase subunit G
MKLAGEYVFDGPREEVWEMMRDPAVLATALPGTQSLDQVSENEYAGKMHVRVGPVSGVFSGKVVISDEVPPESYILSVEGRGGPGFGKGSGAIQLVDQGDGTTLMKYDGELQIGGRLASVGQRLIESVSKSMVRQGLESLNEALQVRLGGEAEETEEAEGTEDVKVRVQQVEYRPPSEVEFATAVARDVVGDIAADIFSPEYRTAWMAAAVAIVGVLVGFWLGRRSAKRR